MIEIRRTEVRADGVGAQALRVGCGGAIRIRAGLYSRENGVAPSLHRIPLVGNLAEPVRAIGRDRESAERIALNPLRRGDGWTEVQEGVQVDLVKEDAKSSTYDQVRFPRRLISDAQSWGKMVLTGVEQRLAVLYVESCSRNEIRNVLLVARHRTKELIAKAIVKVQLLANLPGILEVSIESIDVHKAFGIPHRDGRERHVAGKKVGQRFCEGVQSCAICPRSLSSVESESSRSTAVIELIELRPANLRSITQLMSSPAVGDDVCDVPSEVAPALRRGQASLLKPRNSKIWSTEDGLSVIRRVRAQEQAQGLGIKAAVIVVEDLVEVVGTKEKLIGQLRGKRSDLEVVAQIRAGRSQRGAAAEGSNLVALAHVRPKVKVVFVRNLLVESRDAIVTVTKLGAGTEEVESGCGQIQDRVAARGWPETRSPGLAS